MRDENCIFCKIIAGEIPSNTIYENDEFKVVLDVSPASKGHALILPKNHYADLYEIDENVAADAMKLAKKLGKGSVLINLSGRGDKDMDYIIEKYGIR